MRTRSWFVAVGAVLGACAARRVPPPSVPAEAIVLRRRPGSARCVAASSAEEAASSPHLSLAKKKMYLSTIAAQLTDVRRCYEALVRDKPQAKGRVLNELMVDGDGRVRSSCIEDSTLDEPSVERCISDRILDWRFPTGEDHASLFWALALNFVPPPPAAEVVPDDPSEPPEYAQRRPGSIACGADRFGETPAETARSQSPRRQAAAKADKEALKPMIRAHSDEIKACYDAVLAEKPSLKGRVLTRFAIDSEGRVRSSCVVSTSLNEATLERCVSDQILRWTFSKPVLSDWVVVDYPFIFTTVEDRSGARPSSPPRREPPPPIPEVPPRYL